MLRYLRTYFYYTQRERSEMAIRCELTVIYADKWRGLISRASFNHESVLVAQGCLLTAETLDKAFGIAQWRS